MENKETPRPDDGDGHFETRATALYRKHGNPNGTDYEQGQNDMGHRMVTLAQDADRALAEAARKIAELEELSDASVSSMRRFAERALTAEALLAKAVKGLEPFAAIKINGEDNSSEIVPNGYPSADPWREHICTARQTLSEINASTKNNKDESST